MQTNSYKTFISLLLISLLLSFPFLAPAQDTEVGGQLYLANCAKCHGREGEGFLKLYPPIRNSHYLKEDVSKLPCIIRYGLKGKTVVDGVTFNQTMPPMRRVTPEQMTAIIGFIQHKWEHPTTELTVNEWLKKCSSN